MSPEKSIRTFIAVELNDPNQKSLELLITTLEQSEVDVKWIRPPNIHLTLQFLGDVSVEKIAEIKSSLDKTLASFPKFTFVIDHLGAFPSSERPQIIWVGVKEGHRELQELAGCVQTRLQQLGFPGEQREFIPHVTLGRVRSSRNCAALICGLKSTVIPQPILQIVEEIVIFQSHLTPSGPIYRPLGKISLQK